jgi:hypothetical protein
MNNTHPTCVTLHGTSSSRFHPCQLLRQERAIPDAQTGIPAVGMSAHLSMLPQDSFPRLHCQTPCYSQTRTACMLQSSKHACARAGSPQMIHRNIDLNTLCT